MGGFWAWRVVYHDTACAFLLLLSLRSHLDEAVQADALPIVEQLRDYKDPRYVLAFAHEVS